MKLGLIVGMAVLFSQRAADRDNDPTPTATDVLLAIGLVAVPLGLVMLQPDLGSAMVLGFAALGVFVAAGMCARWVIGLLALAILVAVLAVKGGLLAEYQLARFSSFTHPNHDVQGAAYKSPRRISRSRTVACSGPACSTVRRPMAASSPNSRPTSSSPPPARSSVCSAAPSSSGCSRCCACAACVSRARQIAPDAWSRSGSCAGWPSRYSRTSG